MNPDSGQVVSSDLDLFTKARAGDYGAFEEIARRYHVRIYRLAFAMTANASEAEEVVVDTFLNVFKGLSGFRGTARPAVWIFRVAANSALIRLRAKRRNPLLSLDELPPSMLDHSLGASVSPPSAWSQQPDEQLLTQEVGATIDRAVGHLPEKYRLVLLLRDAEGLSNEEVAETLGLTLPTVKARLHRARMFVRERLDEHFEGNN